MSLFRLTFLARQNAASWSRVVGVGKFLLESFTSEDTQETDLIAAEELVRGLTFDNYNEGIYCKIAHMSNKHKLIRFVKLMVHWYQWSDWYQ